MFNMFKRKQEVKGYIRYFALGDLWENKLTQEQRIQVKDEYSKGVNTNPDSIDKRDITSTTMKISEFLMLMTEYIDELDTLIFLMDKSIEEAEKNQDVEEQHFIYMRAWRVLKQLIKNQPELTEKYIDILKKDCVIHEAFNIEYKKLYDIVPSYPSFKELALIYERSNKIQEAIDVSIDAIKKNVKEESSFERRISKLQKKIKS